MIITNNILRAFGQANADGKDKVSTEEILRYLQYNEKPVPPIETLIHLFIELLDNHLIENVECEDLSSLFFRITSKGQKELLLMDQSS